MGFSAAPQTRFVVTDMLHAKLLKLHIYAFMAEAEGKAIRARTKAALATTKARGVRLGNPQLVLGDREQACRAAAAKSAMATARAADLRPIIAEVRAAGIGTLTGIAAALAARGVPTPSGRGAWSAASVMRLEREHTTTVTQTAEVGWA
jgi:DNA invertase Pin-like site-specific DNA recombinase